MSAFEIRDYEDRDQAGVLALWAECFPELVRSKELIERKRAIQPDPFLVALQDQQVVGSAIGGIDGISAWIYMVAVATHARRQGIGRQIVLTMEQRLRATGAQRINLQTLAGRDELVEFYQSLNYIVQPRISLAKRFH
ncbi:MAG: GNAT family N-acetyltransferase [Pirellulaceae bacterium]|nr:GNAT family N-acetyltransferase [Pirellulaceae bacterium]